MATDSSREVAARIRAVGSGDHVGDALLLSEALVVGEEEHPVGADRPADAAAELMLLEQRLGRREEVARVEAIVAVELEGRARNALVPDLVMMFTTPPAVRPASAV